MCILKYLQCTNTETRQPERSSILSNLKNLPTHYMQSRLPEGSSNVSIPTNNERLVQEGSLMTTVPFSCNIQSSFISIEYNLAVHIDQNLLPRGSSTVSILNSSHQEAWWLQGSSIMSILNNLLSPMEAIRKGSNNITVPNNLPAYREAQISEVSSTVSISDYLSTPACIEFPQSSSDESILKTSATCKGIEVLESTIMSSIQYNLCMDVRDFFKARASGVPIPYYSPTHVADMLLESPSIISIMYNSRNTRREAPSLQYSSTLSIQHDLPNHRKNWIPQDSWPVSIPDTLLCYPETRFPQGFDGITVRPETQFPQGLDGDTVMENLSTDSNQENRSPFNKKIEDVIERIKSCIIKNEDNRILIGIVLSLIGVHLVTWIVKSTEKLKDCDSLGIISTTIRDSYITVLCLLMINRSVISLHQFAYFCITMTFIAVSVTVEIFLVVNQESWLALLGVAISVFGTSIVLCPTTDCGIFISVTCTLATRSHKLFGHNDLWTVLAIVVCLLFASFHYKYKKIVRDVLLSNEFQQRPQEEVKRKAIAICIVGLATGWINDVIWISVENDGQVPIYLSTIHLTIHSILWPFLSHVFLNVITHLIMVHQSHLTEADHCGNKKTLVILFIGNMGIKFAIFMAAKYTRVSQNDG